MNLSEAPRSYYLVCCTGEDLIPCSNASKFIDEEYGIRQLKGKKLQIGDVVIITNVFVMVAKSRSCDKIKYHDFMRAIKVLRNKIAQQNIKEIAFSRCDFESDLSWNFIVDTICTELNDLNITILACE